MKNPFLTIICMTGIFCACGSTKQEIRSTIAYQLHSYPESTLRDVYKNFFQDRFGPGHIVNDTTIAGAYLREELSSTEVFTGKFYEPTGCQGNFYRVNLSVIKEELVDYQTYFDAFIRSVNSIIPPSIEEWKKEWNLISTIISDMDLQMDNFVQDSVEIENLLKQNKYVMHHSQKYVDTYNPHYRIIEKKIFEEELLPIIDKPKIGLTKDR